MHRPDFMRRVALLVLTCLAPVSAAQEIEPRAYSSSPVGTNFAVVGYGATRGDVVFDSSAPFTDVEAEVEGSDGADSDWGGSGAGRDGFNGDCGEAGAGYCGDPAV